MKLKTRLSAILAAAAVALSSAFIAGPAHAATATVNTNGTGLQLTVRESPSASSNALRFINNGDSVTLECYVDGDAVDGIGGRTTIWNRIAGGGYVTDGFLETGSNDPVVGKCDDGGGYDTNAFYLPFPGGTTHYITQANFGSFSHNSNEYNYYAWDFAMDTGEAVTASRGGTVHSAGQSPYWQNGIEVIVDHGNNACTHYGHLSDVSVSPGQSVSTGQRVGSAGATGAASGSHLHYQVIYCNSRVGMPSQFKEVGNPGVGNVTSQAPRN